MSLFSTLLVAIPELIGLAFSFPCHLINLFMACLTTTHRRLNTSPSKIEDKEVLAKLLVTPPIKKIDLHFPLGLEVTARNLRGVTIKDALDAIYKQFKKKV
jgi:hypothetical protein